MIKKIIHIPVFCIILIFVSFKVTNSQELNDYLIEAAENNPRLKSKFYEYQSALEIAPQVRALPDPEISFGFFVMPMETFMGSQLLDISLTQMFPWFGTLGTAENQATLMAKAKYEEFNQVKSELFYDVKTVWYLLYLTKQEIAIIKENIEILRIIKKITTIRFQSGDAKGSMADVLRIQIEINELNTKLESKKDSKKPLIVQFNQLLNRDLDNIVNIPEKIIAEEMPIPSNEIKDTIHKNNPIIKMLETKEEALIKAQELNRKRGYPSFGIGIKYSVFTQGMYAEGNMNGKNMLMPMATVSIPLWRKKYDASVREAELSLKAVSLEKSNINNQLLTDYEFALKKYNDTNRDFDLYNKQTKLAQQTLDILIAEYPTGIRSFDEILTIQQKLFDYELKLIETTVNRNIEIAKINKLLGR